MFAEPWYQAGVVPDKLAGVYGGAGRVVPDIAMNGDPNTGFLGGSVELDPRGFIVASRTMETSIPGVFVAGDVRADSTKQLASAVGEGAAAAIQIRHHIDARARDAEGVAVS